MMIFKRGGGRRGKEEIWKWEGNRIEEVERIKYLGYVLQKNNGCEEHMKEIAKRAAVAMSQVWSIGQRKFGQNLRRRLKMFDSLVKSILMYGAKL